MDKKQIERAKLIFHTSLHMLRDEGELDQQGVKFISDTLSHEINLAKSRKAIERKEYIQEQTTKSYEGIR